jgi:hypothetical protein
MLLLLSVPKDLCRECVDSGGKIFPCWETFEERLDMPMGYFVFYDSFLRAAVGEEEWKRLARGSTGYTVESRMSTELNEAFALVLLKNNYFAWLMEAKQTFDELRTDYDGDIEGKQSLVEHLLGGAYIGVQQIEDDEDGGPYVVLPPPQ